MNLRRLAGSTSHVQQSADRDALSCAFECADFTRTCKHSSKSSTHMTQVGGKFVIAFIAIFFHSKAVKFMFELSIYFISQKRSMNENSFYSLFPDKNEFECSRVESGRKSYLSRGPTVIKLR